MANYVASARTNYFRVKDEAAFRAEMAKYPGVDLWDDKPGLFGLGGSDGSISFYDPDNDNDQDIVDVIAPHLADGEVCIVMEAGAEKLRYVAGYAMAFDNKKDVISIRLDEIYDRAEAHFKVRPTAAEY